MNPAEQATQVEAAGGKPAHDFAYQFGDRPFDGYTIKRGIGRGGFGEVYFALSDGGKETALKLIQRHLEVELRGVAQCLNLKHPNLVALFDVRQSPKHETWVVMEHISGPSLAERLRKANGPLPPEEALQWLAGIGAAVDYLHRNGIVHRDLKPANVFGEDDAVKLGDYGLSKFISVSRRSGQTESVGTVHYMAPEISTGHYGQSIDIYSNAVIAYELLTGDVPFDGESAGEILMKHLTAEPDLNKLDPRVRGILSRALAKDPADRFQTATAMVDALKGAFGLAATPAGPPLSVSAVRNEYAHSDPEYQQYVAALARMRLAQGPKADLELSMAAPPGTRKSRQRAVSDWLWGMFRAALFAPLAPILGGVALFAVGERVDLPLLAWSGLAAGAIAATALTVGRIAAATKAGLPGRLLLAAGGAVVLGGVTFLAALQLGQPLPAGLAQDAVGFNLAKDFNPVRLGELVGQHPREPLRAWLLFAALMAVPNWRRWTSGREGFSLWTALLAGAIGAIGGGLWTDDPPQGFAIGAAGFVGAIVAQLAAPRSAFAPPPAPVRAAASSGKPRLRKLRKWT